MEYIKECPICGTIFTSIRSNAKYCEEHRKNGARTLANIERKQERDRERRAGDHLITYNCDFCGREHVSPVRLIWKLSISPTSKLNWDGQRHRYCCTEHMEQDKHDHQNCDYCNKSLKGCDYYYNSHAHYHYCSAECEKAHKAKLGIGLMNTFTCEYCGKEFHRKADVAYFCSQECSNLARKAGWVSPVVAERKAREEAEKVTIKCKCKQCGKIYDEVFKNKVDAQYSVRLITSLCSPECRSKYNDKISKQRKAEAAKKKAAKAARKPGEPLCATCKVSYKDCERMKSNFRILPEGAHYDDKGILVECPKYK